MTLTRRLALAASVALCLGTTIAVALDKTPFSKPAFDAANASGRPILVEVTAPWCPTCKAQAPILSELRSQPQFKGLTEFNVDFDTQKDALKAFNVQMQSTLIVFKGGKEVGRSTGDTKKASIEALLGKAL